MPCAPLIPSIIPRAWNSGSRELKIHHANCIGFPPRSRGHKLSLSPHTTANSPDSVLLEDDTVPLACYTLRTFRKPPTWCSEHSPGHRDLPRPILCTLESGSVEICPDAAIPITNESSGSKCHNQLGSADQSPTSTRFMLPPKTKRIFTPPAPTPRRPDFLTNRINPR
jgi:hypothetical protein